MSYTEADYLQEVADSEYKYGFVTDIDADTAPKGLSEETVRFISAKKNEPAVDARVAPESVSPLPETPRRWYAGLPAVGPPRVRAAGLPGHLLLLGAQAAGQARQPRRGRPEAPRHVRAPRHPAHRAEAPRRRRLRRGDGLGLRGEHVPRGALPRGRHLLLVWRGRAGAPRARPEVPRQRRPLHRQLLRGPQRGRVLGRLVCLHPGGRALPDGALHLLPHQRGGHGAVRAHAHHRREGQLT